MPSALPNILELTITINQPIVSSSYSEYSDYSSLPNFDYFVKTENKYDVEKEVYDVLMMESFNNFGTSAIYYRTSYDTNYDKIFGEDGNRTIIQRYNIMCYYELPKELELWSKFGIEGLDNFKIYVSKMHFSSVTDSYIPKIGDLIQADYNNRYYEVIDVGEETEMFLQKKHSWTLTVQVFKDDHISLSASLSADTISQYIDQSDLFDLSATIDSKKTNILFSASNTEEDADSNDNW